MRFFLICLSFILTFPSIILAAPPGKGSPPLVKVQKVTKKEVNPPQKYVGHVQAIKSVELKARVKGYLEEINFREGSLVQEDKPLFVIEQAPYKASLLAAKAGVTQAQAELFKAKSRLDRLRAAGSQSVSKAEIDDAIAARDLAKGRLSQAKAELKLARIDMDYTTVKAPISGRIGKKAFDEGDLVSPASQALAQIKKISPIRVVFSVGEKKVSLIQKALNDAESKKARRILSVKLEFSDGTKYPKKGKIVFVNNKVDESTGTIPVWAKFDNPQGRLIPGEYVNALLTLTSSPKMPVVPLSSVQRDNKGAFVFVVKQENRAQKKRIDIKDTSSGQAAVKSGLQGGEKLIVQGIQKVRPGNPVKISGEKNR